MATLYKSIGILIRDYRRWRRISQEKLADMIGVSSRELQNWEKERHRVGYDNMNDLAEVTGIPLSVFIALNADQPIWYSLQERRASFTSIEEHYVRNEFLKYREISGNEIFATSEQISTDKHLAKILSCYYEILGSKKKTLEEKVIKTAAMMLPDLNQILFDPSGHYVGHSICLPLGMDVYRKLKEQASIKDFLTIEKLSNVVALREGAFYFPSIFASTLNVAHLMAMNMARFFAQIEQPERYIFAYVTNAPIDVKLALNFEMVRIKPCQAGDADSFPQLYETTLDVMMGYLGAGEWHVEKHADKTLPGHDVLTIGKHDVLAIGDSKISSKNNEKQKSRISYSNRNAGTCPNPKCIQNGKPGENSIISYGTYRSKDGISHPRFLCKNCGKAFRNKAGTIFYGLRSPEGRVLEAFKLLVRGMPIRRVAAVLGIEYRTVRQWLYFAAKQSDKIDAALIKALNLSQVDLDALWASVNKGALRQRAILWNASNAQGIE